MCNQLELQCEKNWYCLWYFYNILIAVYGFRSRVDENQKVLETCNVQMLNVLLHRVFMIYRIFTDLIVSYIMP